MRSITAAIVVAVCVVLSAGAGAQVATPAPSPTPAPAPAPAKALPNGGSSAPADARACLEFPTNMQIIQCAEKYRRAKARS